MKLSRVAWIGFASQAWLWLVKHQEGKQILTMNILNTDKQGEKDPLYFICPTALYAYLLLFSEPLVNKKHQHVMMKCNWWLYTVV